VVQARPSSQSRHSAALVRLARAPYVPSRHGVTTPPAQCDPCGHPAGVSIALSGQSYRSGHTAHSDWPTKALNVPGVHGSGAEAPGRLV
jgi:hypothetical protein